MHNTSKENGTNYQRIFKALNINWVNSILTILFIGTLYLTVFEINIYRKTLINWIIPTFIWVSTGLVLTPFVSNFLKKHYDTNSFFLQLVYNVVVFGGLAAYGFMATNYYFPNDSTKRITTKIIKTGHFAKGRYGNDCEEPYCEVIIDNKEKQLVFPCDFKIENYTSIELTIKKGFCGFDIITDKQPINK